jgi:chromosome partitioning protein
MTHRPPISRLPWDNGQVTQLMNHQGRIEGDRSDRLSTNLGIETISFILCYCDIQYLRKEFLTVLKYKQHPFTSQIEKLIGVL